MNKICTSLKQSQKLVELGVDASTADMMWDDWRLIDEGWKLNVGYYPEIEQDYGRKCYPAWSLTALLELIPNWTMYKTDKLNMVCNPYDHWESCYEDPVDAAFEMVRWLKINEKI